MFLADWSGRRVAACAILWLVGFPIVTTAFVIMGAMASTGSGGFTVGTTSVEYTGFPDGTPSTTAHGSAWHDSVVREMRRRDSISVAGGVRADSVRAIGFLPAQSSDVIVGFAGGDDGSAYGSGELLPWLLPPALLVAAWAWSRRSRPDPD